MKTPRNLSWLVAGVLISNTALLQAQYNITVLHNNDGESRLAAYGTTTTLLQYGGVDRFATLLDTTRNFYRNAGHGVVSIYAGDTFLAGANFQASLDSGTPGNRTFYDALAISRIGYDASIIGNHEFDFGPQVLGEFINNAQRTNPTTYLSSNLNFSANAGLQALRNAGTIAPSKVVTVSTSAGNKTIGIIGATTQDLPFVSSPENVTVSDVATAVNTQIAALKSQGVNHIILGGHLQGIRTDNTLVSSLDSGIDLIIAGGGSELLRNASATPVLTGAPATIATTGFIPGDNATTLPSPLTNNYPLLSTVTDKGGKNIPIVTSDGNYGYLGRVTLQVSTGGNVTVDTSSNSQRVASLTADPVNGVVANATITNESIVPVQAFTNGLAATQLATTSVQLLHGGSNTIRSRETNLGNFVADAFLARAQLSAPTFGVDVPQISLANAGGIRANIAAGTVSRLDTFNVSPFGNFLAVVPNVRAHDLKLLLENAVSRITDNDAGPGVTPAGGDGRFAQIGGFTFAYDPNRAALVFDGTTGTITTQGQRVLNITIGGVAILVNGVWQVDAFNTTFDIATTAFSANGGDQYFRVAAGSTATYLSQLYSFNTLTGATDQQTVQDYIASLTQGNTSYNLSTAKADYALQQSFAGNRISAIPEPSTYALLVGAGFLGWAVSQRRRR